MIIWEQGQEKQIAQIEMMVKIRLMGIHRRRSGICRFLTVG